MLLLRHPLRNLVKPDLEMEGYMKIEFDTEDIKTEETFAGYFFMLVKLGENLLQQVPSKTLEDLVLSLKTAKRHYIVATRERSGDE